MPERRWFLFLVEWQFATNLQNCSCSKRSLCPFARLLCFLFYLQQIGFYHPPSVDGTADADAAEMMMMTTTYALRCGLHEHRTKLNSFSPSPANWHCWMAIIEIFITHPPTSDVQTKGKPGPDQDAGQHVLWGLPGILGPWLGCTYSITIWVRWQVARKRSSATLVGVTKGGMIIRMRSYIFRMPLAPITQSIWV